MNLAIRYSALKPYTASTSKISVTAAPLADGRVLAMTQDDTPAETVNKWYTKVFEEAV